MVNKYLVPSEMARKFTPSEIKKFKAQFGAFDADSNGSIDSSELANIMRNLNWPVDNEKLAAMIAKVDVNGTNTIEFGEFLQIMDNIVTGRGSDEGLEGLVTSANKILHLGGSEGNVVRTFSADERSAFTAHINRILGGDPQLPYLPLSPDSNDLFAACSDGVLMCKLINAAVPETVDLRAMNIPCGNVFQRTENQNLAINAARAIGVNVINIGASDIMKAQPVLIMGIVWQLLRIELLSKLSLTAHPELVRLLQDGEELEDMMKLSPEDILLRWVNFHLANSGSPKRIKNFGSDIKDGEAYSLLLNQLSPSTCPLVPAGPALKRANGVIQNAQTLDVHPFVTPQDIVNGNARLNLAFVAQLFNACPGLEQCTDEEMVEVTEMMNDDEGDSREERVFRMWMNSLGLDVYVNNLYGDLWDGLVLLKVMDIVEPGVVNWGKVNMNPRNTFKRTENCNYAVVLGKQMKFSLVNVGGRDVTQGNKKLILAIVWQLMRRYTLNMLRDLGQHQGAPIDDNAIVAWANAKVRSGGKSSSMKSFKDPRLASGVFLMDLVHSVKPGSVNWDIVTPGGSEEEQANNAKYVISVARKLGAAVFLTYEDIMEVKSKMLMTFVASMWATAVKMEK